MASKPTGRQDTAEPLNDVIKTAEPEHAEDIVDAFSDEYVKYYGKYIDEEKLEEFLEEMNQDLESGERPEEIVRVVEDDKSGEFMGVSALKLEDNLVEVGSEIMLPEHRSRPSNVSKDESVYERLHSEMLDEARDIVDSEDPANIIYTQLLADKSAASQKVAFDHDFAVTAFYNGKFPVAYEGKGRVTAVDMIWADSQLPNNQEEVYVPEDAVEAVDQTLENVNSKRSDDLEQIARRTLTEGENHEERRYSVDSKAVDKPEEKPMNFAEVEVVADEEGNYSWHEVLEEISEAQEKIRNSEDDYWVGVSLDVNDPYAVEAAEELEVLGFNYAGFNPGKLENGEKRDALEMQYRPSDEKFDKQFIHEAIDYMEALGIPHEKPSKESGHPSSEVVKV
jgi:hypothetical protein